MKLHQTQKQTMDNHSFLRVIPVTLLKYKGKFVPVLFLTEQQDMKPYWGNGGIAPCILDLGSKWR